MDSLSREELTALAGQRENPSVSIYLPTNRVSPDTHQNMVRFKNLRQQAEERLLAIGQRGPDARDLLLPLQELADDPVFWRHPSDGLAVFRSHSTFRAFRLPLPFEDLAVVNDHFHIKPLLRLLAGEGRFYILAFSEDQVRLLEATMHTVHPVELPGLPKDLHSLHAEGEDRTRQSPTPAAVGHQTGKGHPNFHQRGQGNTGSTEKDRIRRFAREIDQALHPLLRNQHTPLVLAAIEYYFPLYREGNTYQYLIEQGVHGNPEGLSDKELHQRALPLVQPFFDKARQDAADRYHNATGTGLSANQLPEVLTAAVQGRVGVLFVQARAHQWGKFDPATGQVTTHAEQQPADEDLLDRAALETFNNRGTVHVLDPQQMPDKAQVAALFRY